MTRSGCTARVPCFTVVSNSADRVMRFRAESTAVTPELELSSQRAAAFAAPVRHDRPPRPGAHPQPEAVHAGTAPVVRLEGPLALCHDSLLVASGIVFRPGSEPGGTRLPSRSLGRLCVSLVTGAGPAAYCADRSRIADFRATRRGYAAAFAGSNLASWTLGITPIFNCRPTCHRDPRAILRKAAPMLQNGWHSDGKLLASGWCISSRTDPERRPTTKRGWRIGFLAR